MASQDQIRKGLVRAELVRLLYTNANVGIWVTVIVAPVLGYLEGGIAQGAVQAWLLYMLAVSAARFTLARLYWRSSTVFSTADTWGAAFAVGAGLSGLGWGTASVLLYTEADLANQVILAFVLGGMMLGAAFLLVPRPAAFLAFIIPSGFFLAARFLLHGDKVHIAMGLLATIFTVVTLLTTWRLYLTVGSSLNLRFENQELVRAQDELLESEERFRSLFHNATVGLYRTTPDGRILMANPVLLGMLGYESFEELSRRNLEEGGFEPRYSRSEFRRMLESEGIVRGLEAGWTRRDGSVLFVRESARAVRGADGRVRYYDGIVEDFTQRKWRRIPSARARNVSARSSTRRPWALPRPASTAIGYFSMIAFVRSLALLAANPTVEQARKNIAEKKYDEAITQLETANKAKPNAEVKKALADAYLAKADSIMADQNAQPRMKYPAALHAYREVLKYDSANQKAKEQIAQIESIYKSMGRPVPQ